VSIEIEVLADPARACAAMLLGAAAGGGHVVLAGGSTPRAAYVELVAAAEAVGASLSDATFWFGDERCVPPEDDQSNYLMAKRALLDRLGDGRQPRVHRMRGELGFSEAADLYEQELRAAGPPQFEVLLLGMGPDGHTLSLFPDQPSLSERTRLVVGVPEAGLEPFVPRVTFTVPAVSLARQVVFLVAGSSKADAVAAAFGPGASADPHLPASVVAAAASEVKVLLDHDAAAKL